MFSPKMTCKHAPSTASIQNYQVLVIIILQENQMKVIHKIYKRKEEITVSSTHNRHSGLYRIFQIIWNKLCIGRSSNISLIYKSKFSSYVLVMGILI